MAVVIYPGSPQIPRVPPTTSLVISCESEEDISGKERTSGKESTNAIDKNLQARFGWTEDTIKRARRFSGILYPRAKVDEELIASITFLLALHVRFFLISYILFVVKPEPETETKITQWQQILTAETQSKDSLISAGSLNLDNNILAMTDLGSLGYIPVFQHFYKLFNKKAFVLSFKGYKFKERNNKLAWTCPPFTSIPSPEITEVPPQLLKRFLDYTVSRCTPTNVERTLSN